MPLLNDQDAWYTSKEIMEVLDLNYDEYKKLECCGLELRRINEDLSVITGRDLARFLNRVAARQV